MWLFEGTCFSGKFGAVPAENSALSLNADVESRLPALWLRWMGLFMHLAANSNEYASVGRSVDSWHGTSLRSPCLFSVMTAILSHGVNYRWKWVVRSRCVTGNVSTGYRRFLQVSALDTLWFVRLLGDRTVLVVFESDITSTMVFIYRWWLASRISTDCQCF